MSWTQVLAQIILIVVGVGFLYGVFVEPILRGRALGRRLEVPRSAGTLAIPARCVVCGRPSAITRPLKPHRTVSTSSEIIGYGKNAVQKTTTTTESVRIDVPYCLVDCGAAIGREKVLSATLGIAGLGGLVLSTIGVIVMPKPAGQELVTMIIGLGLAVVIGTILVALLALVAVHGVLGIFDRTMRLMPLMSDESKDFGAEVQLTEKAVTIRAMSPDFRRDFATLNHLTPA